MTKLYFHAAISPNAPTAGKKSAAFPFGTQATVSAPAHSASMDTTIGSAEAVISWTTLNQTAQQCAFPARFTSAKLAAQTIPAQSWRVGIAGTESNNAANAFGGASIYVWRPGTNTVVGYIHDSTAVTTASEFSGGIETHLLTANGAAVTVQENDVLVVELWPNGTQSMGSSYTVDVRYDGPTEPATFPGIGSASFLDSTNPITFFTVTQTLTGASSTQSNASSTGAITQTTPPPAQTLTGSDSTQTNTSSSGAITTPPIHYVDEGVQASGTASAAPPYYTDSVAGDKAILFVTTKYAELPVVPNDWILIDRVSGGSGVPGIDQGAVTVSIYETDVLGGVTDATTVAITKTAETGGAVSGSIYGLRKRAGTTWQFQTSKGSDNTGLSDWSVTGDTALQVQPDDIVFAFSGINTDLKATTLNELTLTGATFAAAGKHKDAGTTFGDDQRNVVTSHYVTSGSATAVPTYTMNVWDSGDVTPNDSPAGATMFLRVRAVSGAVLSGTNSTQSNASSVGSITQTHALTGTTSTQSNATTAGAITQTHVLTGSGSVQSNTSSTAALSTTISLTGANSTQSNTSNAGSLTQNHILSGTISFQENDVLTGAIRQVQLLIGSTSTQGNTASTGTIGQDGAMVGQDVVQGNQSIGGAITQTHVLTGSTSTQSNASGVSEIAIIFLLAGAGSTQVNSSSIGAVVVTNDLAGSTSVQANQSSTGVITQVHVLTGANSQQNNSSTVDSITSPNTTTIFLSAANCIQSNLALGGSISQTEQAMSVPTISITNSTISGRDVTVNGVANLQGAPDALLQAYLIPLSGGGAQEGPFNVTVTAGSFTYTKTLIPAGKWRLRFHATANGNLALKSSQDISIIELKGAAPMPVIK